MDMKAPPGLSLLYEHYEGVKQFNSLKFIQNSGY